jgi:surfactin family lipopeptide synthetase A
MGIIAHELSMYYQAAISKETHKLSPLPIQYTDYAHWQRDWLKGNTLEQQLDFWRNNLADVATLELPTDYPRPPTQTFAGSQYSVSISTELTQQIRQLSLKANVTLFTALFSVFSLLLSRYSNQEDIAIGTVVAGRTIQEIENLVGFFVNTLVLRADLITS